MDFIERSDLRKLISVPEMKLFTRSPYSKYIAGPFHPCH
jgi:hypothetical protein